MLQNIGSVAVVGAGSAGYLAAVTVRRLLPTVAKVTVVHSPSIPVIGVGEATTAFFPTYLHEILGLDRKRFFAEVEPSWKVGIRFEWGQPGDYHFNYPFNGQMRFDGSRLPKLPGYYCMVDPRDASFFSAIMDRGLGPVTMRHGRYQYHDGAGYHIDNKKFLAYLKGVSRRIGIELVEADLAGVVRGEAGDVESLRFQDGRSLAADLFVDCSGFASLLLGEALGERYVSYADSLLCDAAVVGQWKRDTAVNPYTLAETMDNGWCWQIDFADHVTRGYIHSSQFCSADEAMREMKRKNPLLDDDLRIVKFKSGRYENHWVGNVIAIGNACGFVEPLESTALHVAGNLIVNDCTILGNCGLRIVPAARAHANRLYREIWDDVRNCLAMHYRFNERLDTPFWRHCRDAVALHGAADVVAIYKSVGPAAFLETMFHPLSMFGYDGFTNLLVGQRVPVDFENRFTPQQMAAWTEHQRTVREEAATALPVRQALQVVRSPEWNWPTRGFDAA